MLSKISGALGKKGVSISKVFQEGRSGGKDGTIPIVMLTHEAKTGGMYEAAKEIKRIKGVEGEPVVFRVHDGNSF
jgi:homoserine dehydrogenase